MKVVAVSAARWRGATRRAAGVEPLCGPPWELETLAGAGRATGSPLQGADLLYFNVHGLPGDAVWYGDGWRPLLSARALALVDLPVPVVFTTACYALRDDGTPGPVVAALRGAGCRAVVAGAGANFGARDVPAAVDLLGLWLRRWLGLGLPVGQAFALARGRLVWQLGQAGVRDALQFRVIGDLGARASGRIQLPGSGGVSPKGV